MKYFTSNGVKVFDMEDFYTVCPFTKEEIMKDKRNEGIKEWRHVGAVWALMGEDTLQKAGKKMKRHHATILNSATRCYDAIQGYNKVILEKINEMIDYSIKVNLINGVKVRKYEDHHQNELIALTLLDSKFNELRS